MTKLMTILFLTLALMAQSLENIGLRKSENRLVLLKNANIHLNSSKMLKNASILFKNGRIIAIGKNITAPKTAIQHDLSGKHVYPGFIDVFTQYGLKAKKVKRHNWADGPIYSSERKGGNAWNAAIHSERKWALEFKPNSKSAKSYINQGFTTVQSAMLDGIFRGQSFVTLLNDGLANEAILHEESMRFLSFSKGNSNQWYPSSLMGSIALMRQTFLDADWYQKSEAAYTLNPTQEKPEFNAALKALTNYKKQAFLLETNSLQNLFRADRLLDEFKLKAAIWGSGYEYERLSDVKKLKRQLILSPTIPKAPQVGNLSAAHNSSLAELRHWEMAPYNLGKLEQSKIPFLLSMHRLKNKNDFWKNLRIAVQKGLSKKTALAALTSDAAKFLNISNVAGSIAKGKLANFVVSNKDIFSEKAEILDVWINGKRHIVKDKNEMDFRAYYHASSSLKNTTLNIKGSSDKASGTMHYHGKKLKLKKMSQRKNSLSFSLSADTLDLHGKIHFELQKSGKNLSGYYSKSDQSLHFIEFEYDSAFVEKKNDAKKAKKTKSLKSSLSYPNMAYGFSKLPQRESVLFKNATVWTSEKEGILKETDLLVRNGKIKALGKNLKAPRNTRIIDASNKHLTAGIIDEHSHIAISGSVNELAQAVTAEVRIGDVVDANDINIYRQLAGGVTSSQLLHGSGNPIGGQAQVIKLRWGSSAEEMKFKQAPPSIKFALGENVKHSNFGDRYTVRYPQTRMGVKTIMEDAFNASIEYEKIWKRYNSLSSSARKRTLPPKKDLELDALSMIRQKKMFIHCHSYVQSEILMLMRLAESYNFRIQTFTHILEGYKVADEMRKHGAMASTFGDWWTYKFEVYDAIPYNSSLMTEKKVISSLNSDDAEMARRLNQEAAKSVLYGNTSQEEAWKMVTINPAKQLKVDNYVGSIKVGKDADIVLWNTNPLSVYASVEQTWIDGKLYFDKKRDLEMRKEIEKEKQELIQKIISDGAPMKKKSSVKKKILKHCDDHGNQLSQFKTEAF